MSMTALVSAFARAYHAGHAGAKIYEDRYARKLLSEQEYEQIAAQMTAGVSFFDSGFHGEADAALRRVMDGFLSPTPLARAAFAAEERAESSARQLLLLAGGYDAAGYDSRLPVFELDRPDVLADKQARLRRADIPIQHVHFVPADLSRPDWPEVVLAAGFDTAKQTFCTMMGLCYYLSKEETEQLLSALSSLLAVGSRIALDIPITSQAIQGTLAAGAGEPMKAVYDRAALETMAAHSGLRLERYLAPQDIQARFFDPYNSKTPEYPMYAPVDAALCLLEKA